MNLFYAYKMNFLGIADIEGQNAEGIQSNHYKGSQVLCLFEKRWFLRCRFLEKSLEQRCLFCEWHSKIRQ
jgi:hypothetical protein